LPPQEDGQSPGSTLNRDTLLGCILPPPSNNNSNVDSLRHRSLERTSDIQGARSTEEVLPEAGNKEACIAADKSDALKIEDSATNVSKPVASTQLDKSAADSSNGDNFLPNDEEIDFNTAWYLWYLSDKPPLEGIAGKVLLKIAIFLILVSTLGSCFLQSLYKALV
jgi:hypothetical protein